MIDAQIWLDCTIDSMCLLFVMNTSVVRATRPRLPGF